MKTSRAQIVALLLLTISSHAFAQATRTWISGVGDDANPCSRTAPCKTFAGAISKTAAGGEINAIDSGGFGGVTITKSITLDGGSVLAGVLVSGTNAIVVNAGANDEVVLRNLDINGLSTGLNGVNFLNGKRLVVENSKIYGFTQSGIAIAPGATSGDTTALISNVTLNKNRHASLFSAQAIKVAPASGATATVTVKDVRAVGNDKGIIVYDGGIANVIDSVVVDSPYGGGVGVNSSGVAARAIVENSVLTDNKSGVRASGPATIHLSGSTISRNETGIHIVSGGTVTSFGNNRVMNNTVDGTPNSTMDFR